MFTKKELAGLDPDTIAELKADHDPELVDALLENGHLFPSVGDFIRAAFLAPRAINLKNEFSRATLAKRRAEAEMVTTEAEMFKQFNSLLSTASSQYANASNSQRSELASLIEVIGKLIEALAKKNKTMKEGDPQGDDSGDPTDVPNPEPGGGTIPRDCYDTYKRELNKWHRNKAQMSFGLAFYTWMEITGTYLKCSGKEMLPFLELIIEFTKVIKK